MVTPGSYETILYSSGSSLSPSGSSPSGSPPPGSSPSGSSSSLSSSSPFPSSLLSSASAPSSSSSSSPAVGLVFAKYSSALIYSHLPVSWLYFSYHKFLSWITTESWVIILLPFASFFSLRGGLPGTSGCSSGPSGGVIIIL